MTGVMETPAEVICAEQVAAKVAGIGQIGMAQRVLDELGPTNLVGNRISVAGIEAQLHSRETGGWWQVYAVDGTPPVWTVGTSAEAEIVSWAGAVE